MCSVGDNGWNRKEGQVHETLKARKSLEESEASAPPAAADDDLEDLEAHYPKIA